VKRWGGLHAALKSYPYATSAAHRSWRDDLTFIEHHIPPGEPEIRTEFLGLQAALLAFPAEPDQIGLIHFDIELDNLDWHDDSIAMLDYDDCASYWYAADIAFALRDLFDVGRSLDDSSVRAFLDGYTVFTANDERMLALVPTFSRLSRLFTYVRIMRSLDISPGPEYPDWLNGLTIRLRSHANAYRESLIA
jgi:Ser/Thr protein kinase RdoA (MazF antagonist)